MSRNQDVARVLHEIAELLEIQGVQFKPRAYQRAALNIEAMSEPVEGLVAEGRLGIVPGIGDAIEQKVKEFLETGKLEYLEKLRAEVPAGLRELMQLPNLGPKKAMRLYKELKIESLADLEKALKEHKLQELKGFGEKSEQEIQKSLSRQIAVPARRFDWLTSHETAQGYEGYLKHTKGVGRVIATGSYRRARDTVGDLDILVEAQAEDAKGIMEAFTKYRRVTDILEEGATRSRVLIDNDMQVDLRVVKTEAFGAAMVYFTGSKDHNIAIRALALKKGYTLNEYALTRKEDGKAIASVTEEDVYGKLDLDWVPPEIRENRGEVDLAAKHKLPKLVETNDLLGDLHTHTTESDGGANAKTMVAAGAKRGYEYYGISDHSVGLRIANGLTAVRQRAQRKEIEKLQATSKMRILQGAEMEIFKDGSLDLTRADRSQLDYVIGSVHSAFRLERDEQTKRVLKAMDAGIDILGHPTGRKVVSRAAIDIDLDQVAKKAKENDVLLEVDGTPDRLDLWGEAIHACLQHGAKFIINSDAHAVSELAFVEYGAMQARRGWLTKAEVANTWPLSKLEKHLGHSKK